MNPSSKSEDPLVALYNDLSELPQLPESGAIPEPLRDAPAGMCRCACAKKFISLSDVHYHQSDFTVASDTECRECLPAHKGFALVICLKCKAVVAKLPPKRFQGGFELKMNTCYHVAGCPNCCAGLQKSHLLEKYNYEKERGMPVPPLDEVLPGRKFVKDITNENL